MLAALRTEITKFYRHRSAYVGLVLLVALVGLVGYGAAKSMKDIEKDLKRQVQRSMGEDVIVAGKMVSGVFVPRLILAIKLPVYVFVASIVAMSSGSALANEYSNGTLRTLLTRPVRRTYVVLAKWLVNSWHALAMTMFLGGASLGVGYIALGSGDLTWFGMGEGGGSMQIVPEGEALRMLAAGYALQGLGMIAVASIALFISSFVNRGAVAAIVTLAFMLISGMIMAMPFEWFEVLKPYLITTHMSTFGDIMEDTVDWAEMWKAIYWVSGYTIASLLGAIIITERREIKC